MSPSFGDASYWESRFQQQPDAFDWLVQPEEVRDIAKQTLRLVHQDRPQVLHIGCGSSDLSFELANVVGDASLIHNVDYAQSAVDIGVVKENQVADRISHGKMKWSRVDLLSIPDIRDLHGSDYDLVVDKSTSDSICCSDDVAVPLPYNLFGQAGSTRARVCVHPLTVLAIHLAAVTRRNTARWLVISYSGDRFPFLAGGPRTRVDDMLSEEVVAKGFPDPRKLWSLERKFPVSTPGEQLQDGNPVHRPDVDNWVYVLVRTDAIVD